MINMHRARILLSVLAVIVWAADAPAGEKAREKDSGNVVLDDRASLRTFMVYRTPVVVGSDGEFKEAFVPRRHRGKLLKDRIPDYQSPMPDASWRSPEFDDSEWKRERAPVEKPQTSMSAGRLGALHTATVNSIICARAKFVVDDPDAVGDLALSLTYVGGVAVFLNGREVARTHLPEGELTPETLAQKYPDDLYVTADGKSMIWASNERFEMRYRRLSSVKIPAAMLRKGVNVLALRLHRAPVNETATQVTRKPFSGMRRVMGLPPYVGLRNLNLTASGQSGFTPNVGRRPAGIQVWNCQPFDTVSLDAFGDPGSEPLPIEIDAVRCGTFSGRFVISSDDDIKGLKVGLSELKTADGKSSLPADAVRLRHGRRARASETSRPASHFDGLWKGVPSDVPTVEVSVREWRGRGRPWVKYSGAVLPVWITVRPSKEAEPGLYTGKVTVEAESLEKTVLPLRVRVHDWTLPEPVDWRVRQLNVFSPYSLALHYGVPMWSEKHWNLIEESFRLMYEINARRVDVDLVPVLRARTPSVEHSMLRLVKKKDGDGYEYDFTVIDRLFDTVEKTMKKPLPLQVNCWGPNRQVAVLDRETGKISPIETPKSGTEEKFEFWKPILDELRKRIEKRTWFGVTAFGHQSYASPPKPEEVDVAKRIWPDAVWSYTSHGGRLNGTFSGSKGVRVRVPYAECVWTAGKQEHRGYRRLLKPGRAKSVWNFSFRNGHKDNSPLATLLHLPEDAILRGHDGLGYLCSDFLPIPHSKRSGHYWHLDSSVGNVIGGSTRSFLASGPDGPVATGRYEMLREGSQQCETIIFLERALQAKKISGELADQVNTYLDARSEAFLKGWHVNRRQSDRRLFELATELQAAIGANK